MRKAKSKGFDRRQALVLGVLLTLLLSLTMSPCASHAAKTIGRLTLGAYGATERFKDAAAGSTKNDFLTVSSRLYYRIWDWGDGNWESITDLRDKHDFFEKLNREKLQLDENNTLQLRQMSLLKPDAIGPMGVRLGRFPIPEAGAVFVDGMQIEGSPRHELRPSLFGGYNPKRIDRSYLEFNSKAYQAGAALVYDPNFTSSSILFYSTSAYVTQMVDSETDRTYFFENLIFQWAARSRLIGLMYLDFVPRTYIQNGSVMWDQSISSSLSSSLGYSTIDVIEYSRRQGVRERLASSPYEEASARLDWFVSPNFNVIPSARNGRRLSDGLTLNEYKLALEFPRIFSKEFDLYTRAGSRKNFNSNDTFAGLGIGYFSNVWELDLNADYASEKYDSGQNLNSLEAEAAISNYLSRELFSTLAINYASDENVTIWSAFLKITYRFGNQTLAPIRDGAPPRGRL